MKGRQPEANNQEEENRNPEQNDMEEERAEQPAEPEREAEQSETEDSIIMRGDNLRIVDLRKYITEGKESHFIQINHVVRKVTNNIKETEDTTKKVEFDFMLDLKTLITKTATEPELNRVKAALRRERKDHAPDCYQQVYDNIAQSWGLMFAGEKINIPTDLRKKLLRTLHFGYAGTTKMIDEAKTF